MCLKDPRVKNTLNLAGLEYFFLCVQRTEFEISEILSKSPELYIPNAFKNTRIAKKITILHGSKKNSSKFILP